MLAPLKSMYVTDKFGVARSGGSGLPDKYGTLRHIGVDLRASVGTAVYAPDDGVVTLVDNEGLKLVEIKIDDKLHRFLHLSKNILSNGQSVKSGQLICYSGDTLNVSAHLHWDIRKAGTAWSASFSNYFDPMILLTKGDNTLDDKDITSMYLAAGKSEKDATNPANLSYYRGKKPEQLANDLYKGNNTGSPSYFYKASHYDADVAAAGGEAKKKLEQIKGILS